MRFLTPATLTMALLVVVGGLVVGYVAKSMLATEAPPPEERRNYPMAIADLKPGTVITEAHLAQGPWLISQTKPTYARTNTVLLGRVVKNSLKAATPIDTLDLYPPGEGVPLDIAVGMRAFEINLDSGATMASLAKPGEYLDVHFTPTATSDRRFRGGFTMTMFKGVKVLAVSRSSRSSISAGRGGSNTVTLELTPEQVNIMTLAQQHGKIDLVYTPDGPGDGGVAVADKDRAFFEEILGLKPREESDPKFTEVYYGSGRHLMSFDEDGKRLNGGGYGYGGDGGDGSYYYGPGDLLRSAPYSGGGIERGGNWGYRGIGDTTSANPADNAGGPPNGPAGSGNPQWQPGGQQGGNRGAAPGNAGDNRLRLIPSPQPARQPGSGGGFLSGF